MTAEDEFYERMGLFFDTVAPAGEVITRCWCGARATSFIEDVGFCDDCAERTKNCIPVIRCLNCGYIFMLFKTRKAVEGVAKYFPKPDEFIEKVKTTPIVVVDMRVCFNCCECEGSINN